MDSLHAGVAEGEEHLHQVRGRLDVLVSARPRPSMD
jgi:hypothetical protein